MRRVLRRGLTAFCAAAFGTLALAGPAAAQIGSDRYASIVTDARGNVLSAANPDEPRYPASLTKMMTLYMLFEALRDRRVSMETRVPMSAEAASRMPSKLGLPPGMSVSVEVAIYALVMKSANDVAVAVGELLAGDEQRFAQVMTYRARELGMTRTTFRNASGLPDWDQTTTARDMATLGRRLHLDFPDRWHFFGNAQARVGQWSFRSHNRMIGEVEGVDGIKTGYINASGFNNVVSAQRSNQRVFAAVFGGNSWVERDGHAAMLLDDAFARLGVAPSRSFAPSAPPVAMVRERAFTPSFLSRAEAAVPPSAREPRMAARPAPREVEPRPVAPRELRTVASRPIGRGIPGLEPRTLALPSRARVAEQGDAGRPGRQRAIRPAPLPLPQRARRG